MFKKILYPIFGIVVVMLASACDLSKNGSSNNTPEIRTNTLSSADFAKKSDEGAGIFKDMKSIRGNFNGQNGSKSLQGFEGLLTIGATEIDVNSPECVSQGLDFTPGVQIYYETFICKIDQDGAKKECTVKLGKNESDLEVSRSEACTSSSSSTDQSMTSVNAGAYMPSSGDVSDCQSGFDMFDSLFSQAQKDFEQISEVLKNPDALTNSQTKLAKAELAADEAVAYLFVAKQEMPGFIVKGRVAGGGTDTVLMLRQNLEITTDYSKMSLPVPDGQMPMPGTGDMGIQSFVINNKTEVDLGTRIVTSNMDMTNSQEIDGKTTSNSILGKIEVSDGTEKYVTQNLSFGSGDSTAVSAKVKALLADKNTMLIDAEFTGANAPEGVNFTLVKSVDGHCKVEKKK